MIQVTPVILCGGSGTRLWPLSRTGFPWQFLCLMGEESLFQQAARRLVNLGGQIAASPSAPRNDRMECTAGNDELKGTARNDGLKGELAMRVRSNSFYEGSKN